MTKKPSKTSSIGKLYVFDDVEKVQFMSEKTVYVIARGKVQEVLFKKTLVMAGHRHGVKAGVTNSEEDKNRVDITIQGEPEKVDELLKVLAPGRKLNSIGAEFSSVELVESGKRFDEHTAHTGQFESTRFPDGVEFYV